MYVWMRHKEHNIEGQTRRVLGEGKRGISKKTGELGNEEAEIRGQEACSPVKYKVHTTREDWKGEIQDPIDAALGMEDGWVPRSFHKSGPPIHLYLTQYDMSVISQ